MKNETIYNKTVQILVDAYTNDTLVHESCAACAVGNIIAANLRLRVYTKKIQWFWDKDIPLGGVFPRWQMVFMTSNGEQALNPQNFSDEAMQQIISTGYTWQELAKIEFAFETAEKGESDDEWMFNGLMAVIDVLDIIHENKSETLTSSTKSRLCKSLTSNKIGIRNVSGIIMITGNEQVHPRSEYDAKGITIRQHFAM